MALLRAGTAFVVQSPALVGDRMLRWDFDYLAKHLPPNQPFNVFLVRSRLVMSHSLRYSKFSVATNAAAGTSSPQPDSSASGHDDAFAPSAVQFLCFRDFVAESTRREAEGKGMRPYLGVDLLGHSSKQDSQGKHGPIGERCLQDFATFGHERLRAMHQRGELPLVSSIHLFVGSAATLCTYIHNCMHAFAQIIHYDHNPMTATQTPTLPLP